MRERGYASEPSIVKFCRPKRRPTPCYRGGGEACGIQNVRSSILSPLSRCGLFNAGTRCVRTAVANRAPAHKTWNDTWIGHPRAIASPRVVRIEDLRPLARRRVPNAVFDYLNGGARFHEHHSLLVRCGRAPVRQLRLPRVGVTDRQVEFGASHLVGQIGGKVPRHSILPEFRGVGDNRCQG
jgi:hypothetical protein